MDKVDQAKALLDKALMDETRVVREREGSGNLPFYLSTTRWEMVRTARRLLDQGDNDDGSTILPTAAA
jgi:hypothetical protein